jgi:hypothetical protein
VRGCGEWWVDPAGGLEVGDGVGEAGAGVRGVDLVSSELARLYRAIADDDIDDDDIVRSRSGRSGSAGRVIVVVAGLIIIGVGVGSVVKLVGGSAQLCDAELRPAEDARLGRRAANDPDAAVRQVSAHGGGARLRGLRRVRDPPVAIPPDVTHAGAAERMPRLALRMQVSLLIGRRSSASRPPRPWSPAAALPATGGRRAWTVAAAPPVPRPGPLVGWPSVRLVLPCPRPRAGSRGWTTSTRRRLLLGWSATEL